MGLLVLTSLVLTFWTATVAWSWDVDFRGYGGTPTGLRPVYPDYADCPPITSHYGSTFDLDGTRRQRSHEGIDAGTFGTPVLAPAPGTIVQIWQRATDDGTDYSVLIVHSAEDLGLADNSVSYLSEFDHLAKKDVSNIRKNQRVARGDQIGVVRHPFSNPEFAPEVHWEVYEIETQQLARTQWTKQTSGASSWWNQGATLIDPLYLFARSNAELETGNVKISPYMAGEGADHVGFTYHLRCD